jgi:class 3 adenylate cyclase
MYIRFLLLAMLMNASVSSQNTDSLWLAFQDPSADSISRITSLHILAKQLIQSKPDSTLKLAIQEQAFAEHMADTAWIASALNLQGGAYSVMNDFAAALDRFYRMLDIRMALKDTIGISNAYNNIGNIFYYKGDYPKALDYYTRSLAYEEMDPTQSGLAASYLNIGSVYALQDDYHHALDYFKRALTKYIAINDQGGIASCYSNMGNSYQSLDSIALARQYFLKSIDLMKSTGNQYGLGTVYVNLAKVYYQLGDRQQMKEAYEAAEHIRKQLNDQLGMANLWNSRGTHYLLMGMYEEARKECMKGLRLAETLGVLTETTDACECLYQAYKGLNQDEEALSYFERHNRLKDSLAKDETRMQLQVMEFRNEVRDDSLQREAEKKEVVMSHERAMKKGNRLRNVILGVSIGLIILAVLLYLLFHKTRASKEAIEKEKQKADELLLNILPADITQELMKSGKVEAQEFNNVTILFTDMVGFTKLSSGVQPQQLLDALNEVYSHFDEIVSKHGIEKIKSIGDAYMAAGGLPVASKETVRNTVLAALDIRDYMRKRKEDREHLGLPGLDIRIGIHTGPVVAGIIGIKKFHYDVWGDTVNTASRMEKNSEPNQVNISESTYEQIRHDPEFTFSTRMKIQVKGKGEMQMYFVNR